MDSLRYKDLPLMDEVHAMTFNGSRGTGKLSPEERQVLARYRSDLRRAERFVVDDDAVRLVCRLSHEIEKLKSWAFLARLPHEPMWVEFDLHVKIREFEAMGTLRHKFDPARVSPRLGMLFVRDEDDSPRWLCYQFTLFGGGAMPDPLAFVFDPEGSAAFPVTGSRRWRSPTLSRRPNFPRLPMKVSGRYLDDDSRAIFGDCPAEHSVYGVFGQNPDVREFEAQRSFRNDGSLDVSGQDVVVAPSWFSDQAAVVADPFWEARFRGRDPKELNKTLLLQARELSGALRWVVTLLATINALPRDVREVATRTGRRHVGANVLPYLQHRTVSIKLPRDDRVVWARKSLDRSVHSAKRAWGPVRGHWRVMERGKSTRTCRHEPEGIEPGVGLCPKCGLLVRWVEFPDGRGDPDVGIVNHDAYRVVADRKERRAS